MFLNWIGRWSVTMSGDICRGHCFNINVMTALVLNKSESNCSMCFSSSSDLYQAFDRVDDELGGRAGVYCFQKR